MKLVIMLVFMNCLNKYAALAQSTPPDKLDVLAYHVSLVPDFSKNQIEGRVAIKFRKSREAKHVIFDSGELTVTRLEGEHVEGFIQEGKETRISFTQSDSLAYEIEVFYHGNPKRGLVFLENSPKLYSVYFTSDWMVCNFDPADRATLKLDILVPKEMISIASGVLRDTTVVSNMIRYAWVQDYETPAYTYGFVIGNFASFQYDRNGTSLTYYAEGHTPHELEKIFQYTGDIMSFFEEKSGIDYPQSTYSQVLIGRHYQEMSGFAILKDAYGELVLKDSTETNLISHELAHQWWGNMITCKSWRHFWLNEGLATFMSAAYNEHRFGKAKYQKDIDSYRMVYEKIRAKGGDRSLVFNDWSDPSKDDRNLVYFKGAYVLHLLKDELGEKHFWAGIKYFSQKFYGKSVTTRDFQWAMEKSTKSSLDDFFNEWIY